MMKLAVFGSGRGSNFQAIYHAIQNGKLLAEISVVVVNVDEAPMKKFALENNLSVISIPSQKFKTRKEHEEAILLQLNEYEFDLIILAGYMRILSPEFISKFQNRILNIHPSLLPSFPGLNAQNQALEFGVKITGVTIHLVNQDVDGGKILAQQCVEVRDEDTEETLSQRILSVEHTIYAETIQKIISGEIQLPLPSVI